MGGEVLSLNRHSTFRKRSLAVSCDSWPRKSAFPCLLFVLGTRYDTVAPVCSLTGTGGGPWVLSYRKPGLLGKIFPPVFMAIEMPIYTF